MQEPKMIVLGLLGIGLRYGFEMEAFVEGTDMRQWAKIGMSTIYKTLKDLIRDGDVETAILPSDKGPQRKAYTLTKSGRDRLNMMVSSAFESSEPVYSDRIAGLVFAPLLPKETADQALGRSIAGLEHLERTLERTQTERRGDYIAEAVTQYYKDVYAAERRAMAHVRRNLGAPLKTPSPGKS